MDVAILNVYQLMNATYMNRHGFKVVEGGGPSPEKKDDGFFDETLPTWNCEDPSCRLNKKGVANPATAKNCRGCGKSKQ